MGGSGWVGAAWQCGGGSGWVVVDGWQCGWVWQGGSGCGSVGVAVWQWMGVAGWQWMGGRVDVREWQCNENID
jgi:hypothetical protein